MRAQAISTCIIMVVRYCCATHPEYAQSFEVAIAPDFMSSMYLMLDAEKYRAAARPETRPKTTQSSRELPPRRLLPWTPPMASPAA
mmetsp:Transcript_152961/g.266631  ORF Transcript_152961/g.266631 Transcript_152961/m.266631 type:complete len:86 (+) Transcript_152961:59-316(+)